jgi:hypothetical protein
MHFAIRPSVFSTREASAERDNPNSSGAVLVGFPADDGALEPHAAVSDPRATQARSCIRRTGRWPIAVLIVIDLLEWFGESRSTIALCR